MKIYIGIILGLIITICSACNDFLALEPKDSISDEVVWSKEANADLFLNDIYDNLPDMNNEQQHLDQYTDNSDCGKSWMAPYTYIYPAAVNPQNTIGGPAGTWDWGSQYKKIRKCNLFIEKVNASTALSDSYKKLRMAEVRFLRAYFYHDLWKVFGGVPIITKVLNNITMGDSIYVPRSTANETFRFIQSELTEIVPDLPQTSDEDGRVTQGAALALKGECELYQASPIRNQSNDLSKWSAAAESYKQIIDLGVYSLESDYEGMFLVGGNNNRESIFARQYGPLKTSAIMQNESVTFDGSGAEIGWGNFQPTQDLVDAYGMENGLPITDPASGYDPQQPYVGRDPRFYQSILYDGAPWRDFIFMSREGGNNATDLSYNTDANHTGYAGRKRMDQKIEPSSFSLVMQNYMFYRYATVLLSYAEAMNEVSGADPLAIAAIDQVRVRAGIPTIATTYGSVTQDQLREIIHNERRVELAFEDQRWWDVLRWKIADQLPDGSPGVFNRPQRVMYITLDASGNPVYTIQEKEQKRFLPRMYLMPIPQGVIDENKVIASQSGGEDNWVNGQNPGY